MAIIRDQLKGVIEQTEGLVQVEQGEVKDKAEVKDNDKAKVKDKDKDKVKAGIKATKERVKTTLFPKHFQVMFLRLEMIFEMADMTLFMDMEGYILYGSL